MMSSWEMERAREAYLYSRNSHRVGHLPAESYNIDQLVEEHDHCLITGLNAAMEGNLGLARAFLSNAGRLRAELEYVAKNRPDEAGPKLDKMFTSVVLNTRWGPTGEESHLPEYPKPPSYSEK